MCFSFLLYVKMRTRAYRFGAVRYSVLHRMRNVCIRLVCTALAKDENLSDDISMLENKQKVLPTPIVKILMRINSCASQRHQPIVGRFRRICWIHFYVDFCSPPLRRCALPVRSDPLPPDTVLKTPPTERKMSLAA